MELKRPSSESMSVVLASKRYRPDGGALAQYAPRGGQVVSGQVNRTSYLDAPIMLLTGHDGEIFCARFSPDGAFLASSGYDRMIFLWDTYGECENFAVMSGHGGAILDMCFSSDGDLLYTASTDKTVSLWDLDTAQRVKRIRGHQSFVNSCGVVRRGPQLICSGSDDGTVRLWDRRKKGEVHSFQNTYQVTSVTFNDTGEMIFSGGIDNVIKGWDLRKMELQMRLRGHTDTVTGLALSPDGSYLLSNSMDNSLRIWDVRPYSSGDRCTKVFQGHQHGFEKNLLRCAWSPDNRRISCGSGDRQVHIWDVLTGQLIYKLPGHAGSVNETAFHPEEPIILSAGSDKKIYLGEIEPSY